MWTEMLVAFHHFFQVKPWYCFKLVHDCMDQSPSCVANRSSASQEIPWILCKPKFHLPPSQTPATCCSLEPDHSTPRPSSYSLKIHFNIIPSSPRSSLAVSFPQFFPPTPSMHLFPPICATWPAHHFSKQNKIILGHTFYSAITA